MIVNHFKVAWRSLAKNKDTSIINIAGLTIGLTCFILIALYIQYELSYDKQHDKYDRIYRVAQIQKGNVFRGTDRFARTPQPFAQTMRDEFPEVEAATILQLQEMSLEGNGKIFREQGLFADEHLFEVFTFPMRTGVGKEALRDRDAIILTESLARKYFGNEDAMGKMLLFQGERPLVVKGIVKDPPRNQHFSFQYIASVKNLPFAVHEGWNSNEFLTYLVLPPKYDYKALEAKFVSLDKYLGAYSQAPFKPEFFLQPLVSIHLHSQINFEIGANGDIRYVWLLASIAFIILLLASINYMNLATAISSLRAKEVGVRKVLGAQQTQLVHQFLTESFLLTGLSFILAVAIVNALLPSFNHLLDLDIPFGIPRHGWLLVGMLATGLSIGVLSGLYPGIFLSALLPVRAIRSGFMKSDDRGRFLRSVLVVGQFVCSIVLGIGAMVIFQQRQFIQHKKLGYNREGVVYVPYNNVDISGKTAAIRTELLRNPQIEKVSFPTYMPLNMISENLVDRWEGNNNGERMPIYCDYVDRDFLDLFEIQLKAGRNFSSDSSMDYILNETAVKALGWKQPLGKQFRDGTVVGVVNDFHFQPFGLAIKPMFLTTRTNVNYDIDNIAIRIRMDNPQKTLAFIEKTVKTLIPHAPYTCRFMDDDYDLLYQSEQRFGAAFNIFTLLALLIACMGLFGLVSHDVLQRTKEIGIRKVLGATTESIVTLLSKDFLKLILLAVVIGSPIAWWAMNRWLEDFSYRIQIQWWIFVLVGLVAVGIALLTISIRSIKASLMNPVKSLRWE